MSDVPGTFGEEIPETIRGREVTWIGALSFEERCTSSVIALVRAGAKIRQLYVLHYETNVHPRQEARRLRSQSEYALLDAAQAMSAAVIYLRASPYSMQGIIGPLEGIFAGMTKSSAIVLDISCLTKIHTIAAASLIASREVVEGITLVYTVPDEYDFSLKAEKKAFGFVDVLISPIWLSAWHPGFKRNYALVIPGHEGRRLQAGWQEVQARQGLVLQAATSNRPDHGRVTQGRNKWLFELCQSDPANWRWTQEEKEDWGKVSTHVKGVARASPPDTRITLYPFGPKSMIACAAFSLTLMCRDRAWFVYPIPREYSTPYSSGVSRCSWFEVPRDRSLEAGRH